MTEIMDECFFFRPFIFMTQIMDECFFFRPFILMTQIVVERFFARLLFLKHCFFIGTPVPIKRNRDPIPTVGNRCDRPNRLSLSINRTPDFRLNKKINKKEKIGKTKSEPRIFLCRVLLLAPKTGGCFSARLLLSGAKYAIYFWRQRRSNVRLIRRCGLYAHI